MDERHGEVEVVLQGDLLDYLPGPLQVLVAAGAAAGADDHRNLPVHRRLQHQGKVALGGVAADECFAHAQVIGAGVGASGVASDQVGVFREGPLQGAFLEAVADDGRGGDDAQFVVRH